MHNDLHSDAQVTLQPERFIPGGEALARIPDQPVTFVRGALPGEVVRARVTGGKKQWRRAEVTEVVSASPHRVTPPCPQVALGCGGCDWQHLSPEYQLAAKTQIAIDALSRGAGSEPVFDPELVRAGGRVSPVGYRTTIRVRSGEEGQVGFFAMGSHRVVHAQGCLVTHPGLHRFLHGAGGEQLRIDPGLELILRISGATGEISALWNGSAGAVRGLGSDVVCGADAAVMERVGDTNLRVSAGSFFQSGPQAAELLVNTVARLAPEIATARHIVDAYGGVGLFSATLAAPDAKVTLIESSASAVADAQVNLGAWLAAGQADLQQIPVERWKAPARSADRRVDVVIADPARQGLDHDGIAALVAAQAPVVVLVSCDPAAAARDLRLATQAGYQVTAIEVLDLFPHTHHVEMVSRLERSDDNRSSQLRSAP
jgi:23S rRNA (uracil1939-C5)-methyltransferase